LAFSAVHETLKFFCEDLKKAEFPFRIIDINPHEKGSIFCAGKRISK